MKNTSFFQRMAASLAYYFNSFQKTIQMKLKSTHFILIPLILLGILLNVQEINAQNQVASSQFAYFNHPRLFDVQPVRVKNSAGTVCNNESPLIYNHYIVTGGQPSPGAVSWNDSLNLTNTAKNTPFQNRFKATAGKPTTLTVDIYVGRFPDQPNAPTTKNNFINNDVEARIGTIGGGKQYDETKNWGKKLIKKTHV